MAVDITGSTKLNVGETLNLQASILDEYTEVKWEFKGEVVSSETTYTKESVTEEDAGEYTVTFTLEDSETAIGTTTVTIIKEEPEPDPEPEPEPEPELEYEVYPLEHRNSGFIWIGWWELDQVIKAKEDGEKWQDKLADFTYTRSLKAINKWLTEKPDSEIEVQESRNGYILNREFFE